MKLKPIITDEIITAGGLAFLGMFTAVGFIAGLICGVSVMFYGIEHIVENVKVDSMTLSINQTALVDYIYEKAEREGLLKRGIP